MLPLREALLEVDLGALALRLDVGGEPAALGGVPRVQRVDGAAVRLRLRLDRRLRRLAVALQRCEGPVRQLLEAAAQLTMELLRGTASGRPAPCLLAPLAAAVQRVYPPVAASEAASVGVIELAVSCPSVRRMNTRFSAGRSRRRFSRKPR